MLVCRYVLQLLYKDAHISPKCFNFLYALFMYIDLSRMSQQKCNSGSKMTVMVLESLANEQRLDFSPPDSSQVEARKGAFSGTLRCKMLRGNSES